MIKTGAFVLPRTHHTLNWQSASEQAPEPDLKGFTTALTDGVSLMEKEDFNI